jgi:hypothetical protein
MHSKFVDAHVIPSIFWAYGVKTNEWNDHFTPCGPHPSSSSPFSFLSLVPPASPAGNAVSRPPGGGGAPHDKIDAGAPGPPRCTRAGRSAVTTVPEETPEQEDGDEWVRLYDEWAQAAV